MAVDFLQFIYFGNSIASWAYAFLVVVAAVVLSQIVLYISKNVLHKFTKKTKTDIDDILVDLAEEPFAFVIVLGGFVAGFQFLVFPESVSATFYTVVKVLFMLNIIWFVVKLVDSLFERILKPITERSDSKLDDQILPWLKKSVKAGLVCIGVIIVLDNMGIDVWSLLAGLGIGGIALAFAAQKTIADAFGGLSILFSRPFIVGDTIKFSNGQYTGKVEEINLRHTKVRDLDKQLVVVPNSILASEILTNITGAPKKKVVWTIGLTYNTSNKKLEQAKSIIKKAIEGCDLCDDDYSVVFKGFGASSLDIEVVFYTKHGVHKEMLQARDIVGLKIKKEFEKAKIDFAFPSQTVYLKR